MRDERRISKCWIDKIRDCDWNYNYPYYNHLHHHCHCHQNYNNYYCHDYRKGSLFTVIPGEV